MGMGLSLRAGCALRRLTFSSARTKFRAGNRKPLYTSIVREDTTGSAALLILGVRSHIVVESD